MLLGTVMGTGAQLIGYRPAGPRRYEVQRWISVLFVPVAPLDSWVIEPQTLEAVNLGAVVGQTSRFRVVARTRTAPARVLALYAKVIGTLLAALLPFMLVVRFLDGPPPVPWPIVVGGLLAIAWPIVVLGWVNHQRERLYELR